MRLMKSFTAAMLTIWICAGCSGEKPKGEEQVKLKVMYSSAQKFYENYGNSFKARFPGVEFEIVSLLSDAREADIAISNLGEYADRATNGEILDLEPYIKKDEYDLASIAPAVSDLLKEYGNGKYYGFASYFSTQVLYYNTELFDRYGVPYPQDAMSWADIIQLAQRFPVSDELKGLVLPPSTSPASMLIEMGQAEGLQVIDAAQKSLLLGSPSWKSLTGPLLDGLRSGTIHFSQELAARTPDEAFTNNPFAGGNGAMAIQDESLMAMLTSGYFSSKIPTYATVAAPASANNRTIGAGHRIDEIFSIGASAAHKDKAWDFLTYIGGEEYARNKAKLGAALVSRTPFMYEREKPFEAFYKLGANLNWKPYAGMDAVDYIPLLQSVNQHLNDVLHDKMTWEQAVALIQQGVF